MPPTPTPAAAAAAAAATTALPILFAISGGHLLNDTIQSLLPALYPVLKDELALNFTQGAFALRVDGTALLVGILTGAFLGILGALPPALRAPQKPIAVAIAER